MVILTTAMFLYKSWPYKFKLFNIIPNEYCTSKFEIVILSALKTNDCLKTCCWLRLKK